MVSTTNPRSMAHGSSMVKPTTWHPPSVPQPHTQMTSVTPAQKGPQHFSSACQHEASHPNVDNSVSVAL